MKIARLHRDMTQEKLAELVPDANQAMISALESRDSDTTTLLFGFADALSVDPRWLQTGEGLSGLEHAPAAAPDPRLEQLMRLWRQLGPDSRDTLLSNARWLQSQERPQTKAQMGGQAG